MFEELFARSSTIERFRAAPLAADRLRFLQHLRDGGAKPSTLQAIAASQLGLVGLVDFSVHDTVRTADVEAAARDWARPEGRRYHGPASPEATAAFVRHAVRWLRFLGRLEEPNEVRHPHTAEVAAFAEWMREGRGLSEETIHTYCAAADEFFDWLSTFDIALSSVSITDIDRAVSAKSANKHLSRTTTRNYAVRVRAFFRFAEDQGWCMRSMARGIIPPRVYPDESVPAGLKRNDIQRLLASTVGDRPVDKRDRAILMLLTAYGLRSGEVRGLQLDDLDWEKESVRVRRPKPGRTHLYPLSRGVGQAILRYVLDVRPSRPERTLFFTLSAPIRPLTRVALASMVSRRLDRLGIIARRRGPHALRHAAAQHLLDQGMSMKVIGDFLGHRDPSSTAVYAKLDLNALREVADFKLEGLA